MGAFGSFVRVYPSRLIGRICSLSLSVLVLVFLVQASVVRQGREIGFLAFDVVFLLVCGLRFVVPPLSYFVGLALMYRHCFSGGGHGF